MQIMQALLILTISGVTSAAITIAEPHAFGLIHPPDVSGLFAHDDYDIGWRWKLDSDYCDDTRVSSQ